MGNIDCSLQTLFLLVAMAILPLVVPAQQLHLKVVDSATKQQIAGASITLEQGEDILSFCITEQAGCSLQIEDNHLQGAYIHIQSVGYSSVRFKYLPTLKDTVVYLAPLYNTLPVAKVVARRRRMVKINGDTTSYAVADIKSVGDKTIEDVIKRLPGITVSPSGQISLHGTPIAGLTLDGDDVLSKDYNLGTRAITPDMVDSIQVLERTQKVLALQGLEASNKNYLNLVLNQHAKIRPFALADAAVGAPNLYEANFNAFKLNGKHKAVWINNANNTSPDMGFRFTEQELVPNDGLKLDAVTGNRYFSSGTIPKPGVPTEWWIFNNSVGTQLNLFTRKSKYKTERIILSGFANQQKEGYQANGIFFIPNSTISYSEAGQLNSRLLLSKANHGIEINKPKYFLSYDCALQINKEAESPVFMVTNEAFTQRGRVFTGTVAPQLKIIKHINELWYIQSKAGMAAGMQSNKLLSNFKMPLSLPGLGNSLVSNATQVSESKTVQAFAEGAAHLQSFHNVFIKAGAEVSNSSLDILQQFYDSTSQPIGMGNNNQQSVGQQAWQWYVLSGINVTGEKSNFNAELGINHWALEQYNPKVQGSSKFTTTYTRPSVTLSYSRRLTPLLQISALSFYKASAQGNPPQLNFPVWQNYRVLIQSEQLFPLTSQLYSNVWFQLQKPIQLFWASLSAKFNRRWANAINSTMVGIKGNEVTVLPLNIVTDNTELSTMVSKFLFKPNIQIKASLHFSHVNQPALQNNNWLYWKTNAVISQLGLYKKLSDKVTLEADYQHSWQHFTSRNANDLLVADLKLQSQQLKLSSAVVFKHVLWKPFVTYGTNKAEALEQAHYLLVNMEVEFLKLVKKTPVFVKMFNLLNSRSYLEQSITPEFSYSSFYRLRGVQVTVGIKTSLPRKEASTAPPPVP